MRQISKRVEPNRKPESLEEVVEITVLTQDNPISIDGFINKELMDLNINKEGNIEFDFKEYVVSKGGSSGGGSTQKTVEVDIYDKSKAVKEGTNNVSLSVTLQPNTNYIFDVGDYSWADITLYNASSAQTRRMGNTAVSKRIEFTTSDEEIRGKFNFYPGAAGLTIDQIDFTNVHLYEERHVLPSWTTNTSLSGCTVYEYDGLCIIYLLNVNTNTNGVIQLPVRPSINFYDISGLWNLTDKILVKGNFTTNGELTISTVDTDATIKKAVGIFGTIVVKGTVI